MLRQVGIGAAAVLTAGLLAAGCSDGGDTIVTGGSGTDTSNTDQINATSIASNNLAADGGGFSPDSVSATIGAMKVAFSQDVSTSDGTNGSDGSAMVMFQVNDTVTSTLNRVFLSHFNGSTFTPPTEVKFRDRDEKVASNIAAAAMIYVSTSQYTAATGANADQVNNTRANDGNWYIMVDYTTFFNDPRNLVSQTPPTNTAGPHVACGLIVFVKSLRDQAAAVSNKVGGVNGNFFYGFQEYGTEVNVARSGLIQGGATAALSGLGTIAQPDTPVPPCDVTSFGFVSDGYAGQATFGGTSLPLNAGVGVNPGNAAAYTLAEPVTGSFRASRFQCGEVTNFIGIVYTQIVSSVATGGAGSTINGNGALYGSDLKAFFVPVNLHNNTIGTQVELNPALARNPATGLQSCGTGFYPTFHCYNQYCFVKYADASLNTQVGSAGALDQHRLTPQVGAAFHDWSQAQTGGHEGKSIANNSFYEDICARFRVVNNGDGTCAIATGQQLRDLTFFGTTEQHDLTNPTISATGNASDVDVYPNNREMMNYNSSGQFIFGADEGLLDTVCFYTVSFNSGSPTSPTTSVAATAGANIDRVLAAVGINDQDGSKLASAANQNPRVISTHAADFHNQLQRQAAVGLPNATPGGLAGELRDPVEITNIAGLNVNGGVAQGATAGGTGTAISATTVGNGQAANFFETAITRTGEYIMLGYIQNVGTSSGNGVGSFQSALFAAVYQTQRATTQTGVGSTINFDVRFNTGAAVQISQTLAITNRTLGGNGGGFGNGGADAAGTRERWNGLPVNSFAFQGGLGYRCGLQGNANIVNVLWEQSDETEDRLFVGQLLVTLNATTGTPTLAVNNRLELEPTAGVSGFANFQDPLVSTGRTTTFRLIDQDLSPVYNKTLSSDLGDDADGETVVNAADGGLLVCYVKCIDNTTSDNDHADASVIALAYNGTTAESVFVSESFNENAPVVGQAGNANLNNASRNGPMNYGNANNNLRAGLAGLVTTGGSTQIALTDLASRSEPATGHYIYMYGQRADNSSSGRALYSRKLQPRNTASFTAATIGDRMIPVAATGPGSANFKEPTRLDHLQGQSVRSAPGASGVLDICTTVQNGTTVAIFFFQDGHVWLQRTSDGVTYLNTTTGSPNPALVDNDTRSNVLGTRYDKRDDGNCGVNAGMIWLLKADYDADNRLHTRTFTTTP